MDQSPVDATASVPPSGTAHTLEGTATPNPFEIEGEWLKTQLHCHTTNSDGELRPRALVEHYELVGFDAVAITDHWSVTKEPSTKHLLVIRGAELGFDLPTEGRIGEILAYGIDEVPDDPGGRRENWGPYTNYEFRTFSDLSASASWINAQGGVTYLAHPYWSSVDPAVFVQAEGVAGLEVYNAGSEGESGRGDSSLYWDLALEAGKRLFGIATDDSHWPLFDLGCAWTWIRAAERSEEAVLEALRTGTTYFSTGPVIREVHRDGDAVEIRCSPAHRIILQSQFETGSSVVAGERGWQYGGRILATNDDGLVTHARIGSQYPGMPYYRVTVTDPSGRTAWTNLL